MTVVVPDVGEEVLLDAITSINYTLRLFTNDVTDGLTAGQIEALDESDFTEATFTGYSAATLTGGSWTTTQASPSTAVYAAQTFTSSADQTAQTLYGYYVVRASDGVLAWFEEFTAPLTVEFDGEAVKVTPRLTLADTGD